jgi:hypothetical protein
MQLREEVATLARDVTAPVPGFTLSPRDEILVRRGQGRGLALYQDLARDGHTGAVLSKRIRSVVAREWTVEPASAARADAQAADLVRAALARIPFDAACQSLLGAVLTGIEVSEVMWEAAELKIAGAASRTWVVPSGLVTRDPRRFVFDRDMQLRLLTWDAPVEGIPLPPRKFVLSRFWARNSEDPYGLGLGHALFWPVFFKRNGIAGWNLLAERYGLPFIYAEYPSGTTAPERNELARRLQDLAREAGLVVPEGTIIKLIEASGGSAGAAVHPQLVAVMNAEISKIVLGETLTTEVGETGGAYGLGKVHNEVREELTDADADLLSEVLRSQLVRWIVDINLPGAGVPGVYRRKPDQPDLKLQTEIDEALYRMGWEREEKSLVEVYGAGYVRRPTVSFPSPLDGDFPPAGPGGGIGAPAFAEPSPARRLARRAGEAAMPGVAAMLAQVRAAIAGAGSLDEARAVLGDLRRRGLDVADFAEAMGDHLALGRLAGRAAIVDETGLEPGRTPADDGGADRPGAGS